MKRRTILRPIGPGIAYVPLSRRRYAVIELQDAELVGQWNWYAVIDKRGTSSYAARGEARPELGKTLRITMHSQILRTPKGYEVRHRNGNGLDNRRFGNLVRAKAESRAGRVAARMSAGLRKGVHLHKPNVWRASITFNYRRVYLGCFDSPTAANAARRKAESITRKANGLSDEAIVKLLDEMRTLD